MPSFAELATAVGAMATVVGVSVAATVYLADDGESQGNISDPEATSGNHRYVISDAYYLCRDHIDSSVPYQVRNIHVDSHSSRYDQSQNDNVVFIDLELVERVGESTANTQDAQIVCRVSAANNEIKSFEVNKG